MLRAEPTVIGPVASDPTVSRLLDALAASGERALAAIRAARPYGSNPTTEQWNPVAPRDDTRAPACPPSAHGTKTVHHLRRRTVTTLRGQTGLASGATDEP